MTNDMCPACGSETPATGFRSVVAAREEGGRLPEPGAERATCRCGTPLLRAIGHAWQIDIQHPDGRDTQRAIDEGWKLEDDGVFEPNSPELEGRRRGTSRH
jgi:hypothetical protein